MNSDLSFYFEELLSFSESFPEISQLALKMLWNFFKQRNFRREFCCEFFGSIQRLLHTELNYFIQDCLLILELITRESTACEQIWNCFDLGFITYLVMEKESLNYRGVFLSILSNLEYNLQFSSPLQAIFILEGIRVSLHGCYKEMDASLVAASMEILESLIEKTLLGDREDIAWYLEEAKYFCFLQELLMFFLNNENRELSLYCLRTINRCMRFAGESSFSNLNSLITNLMNFSQILNEKGFTE